MNISGSLLINGQEELTTNEAIFATNPTTGNRIDIAFHTADENHVNAAAESAWNIFDDFRALPSSRRSEFLKSIANEILALGDTLINKAVEESGLPKGRIEGERMRTVNQLNLFANNIETESWRTTIIDSALPERTPPRSDLRHQKVALGPVAVFGASNFPLAFSVAGGDTASALAAGCPVIVKAHSAHPGTSWLVGKAIQKAAELTGMPPGVFSLLYGEGNTVGTQLVQHPLIKAVGFTGSRSGGLALLNIANARVEPIPVYAEMSSINPVFAYENTLTENADSIAQGFAASLTMGAGQFCTNPGVLCYKDSPSSRAFIEKLMSIIAQSAAQTMLTPSIKNAYDNSVSDFTKITGMTLISQGSEANGPNQCQASIFQTTADRFINNRFMQNEVFGACCVLVSCSSEAQFLEVAESLEGQLTCTVLCNEQDHNQVRPLIPVLERKAGRLVYNGYPTGVEVCNAMVHGGPFPATSNSMTTSVGSNAIERFLRPVCYQDFPNNLLPN